MLVPSDTSSLCVLEERGILSHMWMLLQELSQDLGGGKLLAHSERQRGKAPLQQEAGVRIQHAPVDHDLFSYLRSPHDLSEQTGLHHFLLHRYLSLHLVEGSKKWQPLSTVLHRPMCSNGHSI